MINLAGSHWFVMAIIVIVFAVIYLNKARPVVAMLMGVLIFILAGVLPAEEAIAGFSNPSIASVILLILISAGLRNHYNLGKLLDQLYRPHLSYRKFLLFMMSKVALLSSVINNTPVVAIMTPYVVNWGKKKYISPSKLLIPLSFATILGGMITVIGTSTTLVLNGFLMENGLEVLRQADMFRIGIPVTIAGIIFITIFANKLLPRRSDIMESFTVNRREYLAQLRVTESAAIADKTVAEAGLRNLKGLYLVEIYREDEVISPVKPLSRIRKNDRLVFAGDLENIIDLLQAHPGLALPDGTISHKTPAGLTEAVISNNSSLIGRTIRDSDFRARYDGAIVAIHRNGEKLSGRIGDIRLASGDALLIVTGHDFADRVDLYKDLFVISTSEKEEKETSNKSWKLIALLIVAAALGITRVFSLFATLLVIFVLMVVFKLVTIKTIKRDLDYSMVGIMVLSLALGQAMIRSGTGEFIATALISVFQPFGSHSLIIALLLITTILTSFVSNIGAVSIMFPIGLGIIEQGMVEAPFVLLAITYAASAAFVTPIGYQTNMIIYGPGGYTFRDFLRIGLPVSVVYLAVVYTMITLIY